jgi:hypothetical protein
MAHQSQQQGQAQQSPQQLGGGEAPRQQSQEPAQQDPRKRAQYGGSDGGEKQPF